MMKRKRILALSLLLLCVVNLTGCSSVKKGLKSIGESIEKTYQNVKEDYEDAKAAKNKKQLTADEYDSVVKDAYDSQGTFAKFGTWIGAQFSGKSKYEYYASKNEGAVRDRVEMAANDKRLAAEQEERDAKVGALKGGSGTAIIILVLVAVVVVVLIYLFMKMRQKSAPPVRRAKSPGPTRQSSGMEDVNVKYERVLKDNCSKLGLDYDETLQQYGDARAAVDATNLQLFSRQ